MELIDLSSLEILTRAHFPTLAVAQHVVTRSAARAGFVLHLSISSKQPYVRLHCYKRQQANEGQACRELSMLLSAEAP
jgi:hypothetical protein